MIKKYNGGIERKREAMDEIMTGDGKQGVSEGIRGWEGGMKTKWERFLWESGKKKLLR